MGEKTETCALCTCHPLNHLSYTLPLRSSSHKVGCAPVANPGLPLVSPLLHAPVRDRSEMRGCIQHATSVERKITALKVEQAGILQDANELGVELTIGEPLHVSQPAAIFDDNMEYARLVGELEAIGEYEHSWKSRLGSPERGDKKRHHSAPAQHREPG